MPHRAPFLCLNWGAVCAPMNYSIYLLCRSEVCLEKRLPNTKKIPPVRVRSFAQSLRTFLTLLINLFAGSLRSAERHVWVQWSPTMPESHYAFTLGRVCCSLLLLPTTLPPPHFPLPILFLRWPLYGTCGLPAIQIGPCLAELIFGQLGSVYMSVKPHQCWAARMSLVG